MAKEIVKVNSATGKVIKTKSYRALNGKPVHPVLYMGRQAGYGNYMSGSVDNKMVVDANDKPIPLKQIGEIVHN